ncbi:MAG: hypothetical protein ACI9OB_000401 [Nonlabens sp.]|jgi:hypothetical protein
MLHLSDQRLDMQAWNAAALAAVMLGAGAVTRHRVEARSVKRGDRPPIGPDSVLDDDTRPHTLHRAIAGWQPSRPHSRLGQVLAAVWSSPLTCAGVTMAALGGQLPTVRRDAGCLVAVNLRGPAGAFLAGQGAAAATLGQLVIVRAPAVRTRLLAHEVVHVRQQERLGPLFALAYPLAQLRWGYRANPFEIAARRGAANSISEPATPS